MAGDCGSRCTRAGRGRSPRPRRTRCAGRGDHGRGRAGGAARIAADFRDRTGGGERDRPRGARQRAETRVAGTVCQASARSTSPDDAAGGACRSPQDGVGVLVEILRRRSGGMAAGEPPARPAGAGVALRRGSGRGDPGRGRYRLLTVRVVILVGIRGRAQRACSCRRGARRRSFVAARLTREFQAGRRRLRLGKYDDARAHLEKGPSDRPPAPARIAFLAAVARPSAGGRTASPSARRALPAQPAVAEARRHTTVHDG